MSKTRSGSTSVGAGDAMQTRRSAASAFDPLFSVVVCFIGALVLVIVIMGIDASDKKVVLPTPIDAQSARRPIYVECRGNELFLIPVEELSSLARRRVAEARGTAGVADAVRLEAMPVTNEHFQVDLRHFLAVGGSRLAIRPVAGAHGYPLRDPAVEPRDGWFGQLLQRMNHEGEMIQFLVRDDSFRVFKNARTLALYAGAEVAFELLTVEEAVSFPTMFQARGGRAGSE